MKLLLRYSFALLLLALFADKTTAQSIWTNPITNANPSASNPYTTGDVKNANIAVSGIGRGAGIAANSAVDRYDAIGWNSPALQADDYFTFTITPNAGFSVSLVSFVYAGQTGGTAPTSFTFKSSVDGYNASIGTPTAAGTTISLSGAAYQNLTSGITFRLYAYGASLSTGTFSVNDFTFNGTVTAIAPTLTADLADNPTSTNVGGTINYKTTITNSGTGPATSVAITNTAPGNTTYTPNSQKTSALARDDNFTTSFNTTLASGNVVTNDFGLPSITVVSFGPTVSNGAATLAGIAGTTNGNGTLTVNGNGTFNYTPLAGFSGVDKFSYIATTGAAGMPNDNAVVTILVSPDITFSTINVNPTCSSGATGSITFNASGGSGNLTYSITGAAGTFQASNVFSNLGGATYNLAVKDATGYIKTGSMIITQPTLVSYSITATNPTCNGLSNGSITFDNAQGGTGALMFSIHGNAGPYQLSNIFTGLAAGSYTVTAKDANDCGNGGPTYDFTNPTAVIVGGSVPTLTYNTAMTTATFTKSGGTGILSFSKTGTLPNGLTFISGSAAGAGNLSGTPTETGNFPITIIATDANGCTGSLLVTVSVTPNLTAKIVTDVANTQLNGGLASPPAIKVTVVSSASGNTSNTTIAYAVVTAPTKGTLTTFNTDGTFLYTPNAGSTVQDVFTYSGTSNGATAQQTVTINFNGKVWYVQGGAAAGDGRSNTPFNTLASIAGVSSTSDFIYVEKEASGTTPGAITLQASQQLIGAGATLSVPTSGTILTIAGNAANYPTLTGTVTLANTVNVDGIDMSTTTFAAVSNGGATVTGANVTARNITTTSGAGVSITGTGNTVSITLTSLTTGSAVNAVNLTNVAGTVTINGGTIAGAAGAPINISGGTVSLTYSGSASQATASQPLVSVSGGHATGTITFQTGILSATNGTGLQFDNADGVYNFNGTTTLNGVTATRIDILNGSSGTFTFGTGTSVTKGNGIAGAAFNLTGSNAVVTYNGAITLGTSTGNMVNISTHASGNITFGTGILSKGSSTTQGISISGLTGGTVAFNNPTISITMGATGNAIDLSGNSGGTINFTPAAGGNGIDLVSQGGIGYNATGGGIVSVTGTGNTITSTTGTALNVANTTIGASGLTFQSISANGGANGIILDNTGALGGLTVTGTIGSVTRDNTGGTIQNLTGADNTTAGHGVYLNSTLNPSLNHMNIHNNQGDGIHGNSVNGFTLTYTNMTTNGTTTAQLGNFHGEGDVNFVTLSGSAAVNNNDFQLAYYNTFGVFNDVTPVSLNRIVMSNNTFGTNDFTGGNAGVAFRAQGGTMNITFGSSVATANTITGAGSNTFILDMHGTMSADLIMKNNAISNNHGNIVTGGGGVSLQSGGVGDQVTFTFNVDGNTFSGSHGAGFNIGTGQLHNGQNFSGTFNNNTIGIQATANSGSTTGNDLFIQNSGSSMNINVTNNKLYQYNPNGTGAMQLQVGDDGSHIASTKFVVTGNTISNPGSIATAASQTYNGIQLNSGPSGPDAGKTCLTISGNVVSGSGNAAQGSTDIRLRQRALTDVYLPGYGGAVNDATAVNNYVIANNPGATSSALTANSPPHGFGGTCPF